MIKKIIFLLFIAFALNTNAQTTTDFSTVKTHTGDVKIPGNWEQICQYQVKRYGKRSNIFESFP